MIQWGLICSCSFLGPQDEPSEKSEQKVLEVEQADLFLGGECGLDPARATQLCTKPSGCAGWSLGLWVGCAQALRPCQHSWYFHWMRWRNRWWLQAFPSGGLCQ